MRSLLPTPSASARPQAAAGSSGGSEPIRLPAAPLLAAINRRGGLRVLLAGRRHTPEGRRIGGVYQRARTRGWVTVAAGDELACRCLGVHPCAVWGAQFWAVPATAPNRPTS